MFPSYTKHNEPDNAADAAIPDPTLKVAVHPTPKRQSYWLSSKFYPLRFRSG